MSTEAEFLLWLRRPGKSLLESIQFVLKAWQSAEFNLSSKYEVIIQWLLEQGEALNSSIDGFPYKEFSELLQQRAQPFWVPLQLKREFVNLLLNVKETQTEARLLPQLLQQLCEFELMQDLYRSEYTVQSQIFGKLFKTYENYLSSLPPDTIQLTEESEFMVKTMNSLKDSMKRAGNLPAFEKAYTANVVEPLVEVLLVLERFGLSFYEDFYSLEIQLTQEMSDSDLLDRPSKVPLHVQMLMIESSIINRRGVTKFLQQLLGRIFAKTENSDPLSLCIAAYTLEILHKHEINLNFVDINKTPALEFIGLQILGRVQAGKDSCLRECLMLLCSALRFNPLILEKNIFQYTTWMIVAQKSAETQIVFEEFLMLLMDMFRRLSRTEKLVVNLLRALKEWLKKYKLPVVSHKSKRKDSEMEEESEVHKTKRKRKEDSEDDDGSTVPTNQSVEDKYSNKYIDMIFAKVYNKCKRVLDSTTVDADPASSFFSISQSFPLLDTTWPSRSVGLSYARLITGLMTKPSLVIWKTLLYSFKEQIVELKDQPEMQANDLFFIDYHAALLSEYFVGSRITEQYNKFSKEVNDLLEQTKGMLGQFGQFILSHEHNQRTMNAFLECVYHAANFYLLLAYYKPDGCDGDSLGPEKVTQELHAFLQPQEWTLIEQRVLNFGTTNCKFLLNRLLLQRNQSKMLLMSSAPEHIKTMSKSQLNEEHVLDVIRQSNSHTDFKWLLATLKRDDKLAMAMQLIEQPAGEVLRHVIDDLEMLELLSLSVYEKVTLCLSKSKHSQNSLLMALKCDYRSLLTQPKDTNAMDKYLSELVGVVCQEATKDLSLKKLPKDNALEQCLETLQQLPLGSLRRQWKLLIFIQQMALYTDLKRFDELNAKSLDILTDILHFGHKIAIFKYFSIDTFLQLFPIGPCWRLYEYIFANIKNEDKGLERFLTGLEEYVGTILSEHSKLDKDQCRLLMLAIESLGGIVGPASKRVKKNLSAILEFYGQHVKQQFADVHNNDTAATEEHRKFVKRTLAGFSHYAKAVLNAESSLDDNFRRICKIYIGHSMDYRNPQAVRLMQVALNHRKQLHLDQDEIEFALSGYWRQLLADIRNDNAIDLKNAESVVKMIIDHKTNEDFLLTMRDIGSEDKENEFLNVLRLLTLIAKCPFSTIKGAIFNEHFKQITSGIRRLTKGEKATQPNSELVMGVLKAQQTIVENKMVPLSSDTLDSILAFLIDINLKKFPLNDNNLKIFNLLHQSMTDLCMTLVKHRHILLMDRVPHFMHIFKDLLQSIVWYKSDRQGSSDLLPDELNDLSELAAKLEALMHVIAAHGVSVKRVAPFVLTFAINLMVANKRATTLYPKIKTHVDGICFYLIGICDHRVGRFILRCSNEAAGQVYETMLKDHKKYYKFKGKV